MTKQSFKTFGEALKNARKSISLTQSQLAYITRIHRTTIVMLENDKRMPSPDNFYILCSELGLNRKEMFSLLKENLIKHHNEVLMRKYRKWL